MRKMIVAAIATVAFVGFASVALSPASASATPLVATAGAQALAGAVAGGGEGGEGGGGGTGIGQGSGTGGSSSNTTGDTKALGLGIAQAPTAVSGICGKGNKVGFGAFEFTDFSSKCFNYMIAMEAAKRGEWALANQWVERADGM